VSRKNSNAPSRLNWEMIRRDVVNMPGMSLDDAAEKYGVTYETMRSHGGPNAGNWIAEQKRKTADLVRNTESRRAEILAKRTADDIEVFDELGFRLQRGILLALEMLFPPEDAPLEVRKAAQARLDSMTPTQIATLITNGLRALLEVRRHRRLLNGESTVIFERASCPDVCIPLTPEQAQALEGLSRRAQNELLAIERNDLEKEETQAQAPPI